MTRNPDKILSASRRTDIPAFYMDWFMDGINQGFINVKNPYNKIVKRVDLSPKAVHSIVFWSKNYDAFIKKHAGEELEQRGFHIYFNFTINSESAVLEPNLPSLKKRLKQLETLASVFGPEKISWRFDPICFYDIGKKGRGNMNNLSDFPMIADVAATLGINKCVSSFFDDYQKIQRRIRRLNQTQPAAVFFTTPAMGKKTEVIHRMARHLKSKRITLYLCCEKEVFSNLDADAAVLENACIDGRLLKSLFGGNPVTQRDYGQRSTLGCRCTKSIDIGSYDTQPCFHNCLFCYANPDIDNTLKKANIQ